MDNVLWSKKCDPGDWSLKTETVQPHQVGWLRRKELDRNGSQVWELPDGRLYAYHGQGPLKMEIVK